jgi:hypothetical protein
MAPLSTSLGPAVVWYGDMATMLERARDVGCPSDQVRNFLKAGYVPQPKQMEFHAACRACDDEEGPDQVGFGGSRGPGKSHAAFAQVALDDCQRIPGLKALYLRKVSKNAREQFDDLRRTVLRYVAHRYTRAGLVEFPNGSRIVTGHFKDEREVDNYLGMEYDVIVVEEATTLTSTKIQALRDSNRSSKIGWRPRIYLTTNPGSIGHVWFKQRFVMPWRAKEEKWTRFVPATLDDNAFLDPGYRRKVEENVGWRLRAYRYGDWDVAAGQYFVNWRHDVHVVEPFAVPESWKFWAAMDYGYIHPTCFLVGVEDGDGVRYVIGEHWQSRALPPAQVRAIREMVGRIDVELEAGGVRPLGLEDLYPVVAGVDVFAKKGHTSLLMGKGKQEAQEAAITIADQYADEGLHLMRANVNRILGWGEILKWLGNPMPDVDEEYVQERLYVFSTCVKLIETLPGMIHDPHNAEDVLKVDIGEDGVGGDDAADALRYLIMAQGMGARPSEVIEAPDAFEEFSRNPWGQRGGYRPYMEDGDERIVAFV